MIVIKVIFLILIAFSGGIAISTAFAAFLTTVGFMKVMVVRTKTYNMVKFYEILVFFSVLAGTLTMLSDFKIVLGKMFLCIVGFFNGAFVGVVAISLAEVLNVFPVLKKRAKLKKGLKYLILTVAIGKIIGSLVYWIVPGFIVK